MLALRRRGWPLVALGFGLVASCRPEPAPLTPPSPPAPSVEPAPPPELEPSDAAAPWASDAAAPDAGAPPVASGASSPFERPDPGPGSFSCGGATCKAGAEVCAPREECVDRKDKACVAGTAFKARKYSTAACTDGCFSWFDEKSCDGQGDCKADEVCCYDGDLIIGPCDEGEDGVLDVYQCKRAVGARTPCGTAELCSAKDPTCKRPGSSCVVDPKTGRGTCVVPRRLECGGARCGPGHVCVEWQKDSSRTCEKEIPPASEGSVVRECDRGRDCAPDEACFESPGGRRCDLSETSWAGQDVPVCEDASDCKGLCGATDAVCYEPAPGERKLCECRPPCKRDADCKKSDYCSGLSFNRYGGALMKLEPFCETKRQRCNCREPSQP